MLLSSHIFAHIFLFLKYLNGFAREEETKEAHVIIFFIHKKI
jgi:hypothetical protein